MPPLKRIGRLWVSTPSVNTDRNPQMSADCTIVASSSQTSTERTTGPGTVSRRRMNCSVCTSMRCTTTSTRPRCGKSFKWLYHASHGPMLFRRPYDVRIWQAQGMCYEEMGRYVRFTGLPHYIKLKVCCSNPLSMTC